MSAAPQLPLVWGAGGPPIPWQRRVDPEAELPAVMDANESEDEARASDPPIALALFSEAYGTHVASLSVLFDAGVQIAVHSRRFCRARMGFEPAGADVRGCGNFCAGCGAMS